MVCRNIAHIDSLIHAGAAFNFSIPAIRKGVFSHSNQLGTHTVVRNRCSIRHNCNPEGGVGVASRLA